MSLNQRLPETYAGEFAARYAGQRRWCAATRRWYELTDAGWVKEGNVQVIYLVRVLVRELARGESQAIRVWAASYNFVSCVEHLCRAHPAFAAPSTAH